MSSDYTPTHPPKERERERERDVAFRCVCTRRGDLLPAKPRNAGLRIAASLETHGAERGRNPKWMASPQLPFKQTHKTSQRKDKDAIRKENKPFLKLWPLRRGQEAFPSSLFFCASRMRSSFFMTRSSYMARAGRAQVESGSLRAVLAKDCMGFFTWKKNQIGFRVGSFGNKPKTSQNIPKHNWRKNCWKTTAMEQQPPGIHGIRFARIHGRPCRSPSPAPSSFPFPPRRMPRSPSPALRSPGLRMSAKDPKFSRSGGRQLWVRTRECPSPRQCSAGSPGSSQNPNNKSQKGRLPNKRYV